MSKTSRVVYTLRGWMAFIAFIQFGTAMRCFVERDVFLGAKSYVENREDRDVGFALSRMYSMFSILLAVIIVQCALHIHYKTIRQLTLMALALSLSFILTEIFYFNSFKSNEVAPYVFALLHSITLICLWASPWFFIPLVEDDDEKLISKASAGKPGSFNVEAMANVHFRSSSKTKRYRKKEKTK